VTRGTIGRVRRPGRKPLLDESRFIPCDEEQERQLLSALLDTGTGPTQAVNIVRTLASLPGRDHLDNATSASLSLYRRRLREVGIPPWEQDDPPRPSVRLSALLEGAGLTGADGGELESRRRPRRPPPARPVPGLVAA